jgi:hypothetical protein
VISRVPKFSGLLTSGKIDANRCPLKIQNVIAKQNEEQSERPVDLHQVGVVISS